MRSTTLTVLGLSTVLLVPIGGADPESFIAGPVGDGVLICDLLGTKIENIGGVCFEPGHLQPGPFGENGVYFQAPCLDCPWLRSGFYCQGSSLGRLGEAVCEVNSASFCDSHLLQSGVNWTPGLWDFVWADGPVFGSPLFSACGALSMANFAGEVGHIY